MTRIITRPRAVIEVGPDRVYKRFNSYDSYVAELRWYNRVGGWAAPHLIDSRTSRLELVIEKLPVAHGASFNRAAAARDLYRLLRELSLSGIHHRDVHPKNIVLRDGRPLLIDWEFACLVPDLPSYDLVGPAVSGIAAPRAHQALRSKVSPNGYCMYWGADHPMSIQNQWGVTLDELSGDLVERAGDEAGEA